MESVLIQAGRLISTSDMKMARKLQQVVNIDEITHGDTPEELRQVNDCISFMFRGEFYELAR